MYHASDLFKIKNYFHREGGVFSIFRIFSSPFALLALMWMTRGLDEQFNIGINAAVFAVEKFLRPIGRCLESIDWDLPCLNASSLAGIISFGFPLTFLFLRFHNSNLFFILLNIKLPRKFFSKLSHFDVLINTIIFRRPSWNIINVITFYAKHTKTKSTLNKIHKLH